MFVFLFLMYMDNKCGYFTLQIEKYAHIMYCLEQRNISNRYPAVPFDFLIAPRTNQEANKFPNGGLFQETFSRSPVCGKKQNCYYPNVAFGKKILDNFGIYQEASSVFEESFRQTPSRKWGRVRETDPGIFLFFAEKFCSFFGGLRYVLGQNLWKGPGMRRAADVTMTLVSATGPQSSYCAR